MKFSDELFDKDVVPLPYQRWLQIVEASSTATQQRLACNAISASMQFFSFCYLLFLYLIHTQQLFFDSVTSVKRVALLAVTGAGGGRGGIRGVRKIHKMISSLRIFLRIRNCACSDLQQLTVLRANVPRKHLVVIAQSIRFSFSKEKQNRMLKNENVSRQDRTQNTRWDYPE